MKIGIACGGTGGHLLPGVTMGRWFLLHGHDVTLWVDRRGATSEIVSDWGGRIEWIAASGFGSGSAVNHFVSAVRLAVTAVRCVFRMRAGPPCVLLAMGSYASVGPVVAARCLRVPVVLHEANAVPGRAVCFLSRFAKEIAISFEAAREHLRHRRIVLTGFPVRRDLDVRFDGSAPDADFTVLIMGGSQGARTLDRVVSAAIRRLRRNGYAVGVVHLCRPESRETLSAAYREDGVPARVFGFLPEIGKAYHAADVAIARAGAATCAELAAFALPALLVPLPGSARGHQHGNALALQETGGIDIMEENTLTEEAVAAYLAEHMRDRSRLNGMRDALCRTAWPDGVERLAAEVLGLVSVEVGGEE